MDDKVKYPQLMKYIVILNRKDNVGVAFKNIPVGRYVLNYGREELYVTIKEEIKAGFKIGLRHIKKDDLLYKYGYVIGVAYKDIKPGEKIHIHNMCSLIKKTTKGLIINDTKGI